MLQNESKTCKCRRCGAALRGDEAVCPGCRVSIPQNTFFKRGLKEDFHSSFSDEVNIFLRLVWDSNVLTVLALTVGIWLAVFFGLRVYWLSVRAGVAAIMATVITASLLVVFKWRPLRNRCITFFRSWLN